MVELAIKSMCTGCSACCDACPQNAISMEYDEEGFLFPHINKELCCECGLCQKTCPTLSEAFDFKAPLSIYAGWSEDKKMLKSSTSGGIFIPLIVTNCIVVGRAEAFAAKKGPALSALDGFSIGMGATCAMFVLGSLREIIGNGTLFDGADALLGSWAKVLRVEIFHTDSPFLLAMLPPGAFIGLGLMLAGKYLIDERMKKRRAEAAAERALPNGETGNV